MKNKSGVTLIMLVIIILIMTTLLAVVTINGTDIYNATKTAKLQSEINQLEVLVQNYVRRNQNFEWDAVEVDISEYSEDAKKQFADEIIVDGKLILYAVNLEDIDAKEVSYGNQENGEEDRYLYSNVTKKVYYQLGRKIGNIVYYRVDE